MQCLSVKQPWATLLVGGVTQYLVRDWRTFHRGSLAIQASRHFPRGNVELCCDRDMRGFLRQTGHDYAMELPTSALVGTADLADCIYVTPKTRRYFDPEDPAVRFGLVQPGMWVWVFQNAESLAEPYPMSGRLGVFSIPDHFVAP